MKLRYLLIYLLLFPSAYGQFPQPVYGSIQSSKKEILAGATVLLLMKGDSSQVDGVFTSNGGDFYFSRVHPGEYVIRASFVGYKPATRSFRRGGTAVNLGSIRLDARPIAMDSLQVTDFRIPATLKGDATEYNAENFHTTPQATAENLVEKLPGATVQYGNVEVQGESVKKVLVDSRPFFGDDPSATLKNIPAEIIQQIQIFDQRSEQAQFPGFEDGETSKTINLITKPQYRHGTFGNAAVGAGNQEPYQAGGIVNSFNSDKRLSVLAQTNNINLQIFSAADIGGAMNSSFGRGGS